MAVRWHELLAFVLRSLAATARSQRRFLRRSLLGVHGTWAVLFACAKALRDSFRFSIHMGAPHMGKGDVRTRRGKINRGTFGNARRRKKERKLGDGGRTS